MRGVTPDIVTQFERASGSQGDGRLCNGRCHHRPTAEGRRRRCDDRNGPSNGRASETGQDLSREPDRGGKGRRGRVRSGWRRKPDISSVDGFKRTLLAAKSIGYGDPTAEGVSGVHMAALIERLGIATELKPKIQLLPNSQAVLDAVAKGNLEIGIGLTSDTALVLGIDLAAALPAEIQNFTLYVAGIPAASKQADAAKALINFLSSPAAQAGLKAKGFEPR